MIIDINNISFFYSSTPILKSVSIQINAGEFVGIVGPNGSGKSTLLKIMLGFETQSKGTVKIFGKGPSEFKDWNKVGYVPQKIQYDSLFPITVKEILATKNTKPHKIVKELQIKSLFDKQFHTLSGGQKQKVMIAFALHNNPKLLILDEPEAGVDAHSRDEFFKLLKHINDKYKTTIVLCSHDIGMVSKYCKRILCVHQKTCTGCSPNNIDKVLKDVYGSTFTEHESCHSHTHPHQAKTAKRKTRKTNKPKRKPKGAAKK